MTLILAECNLFALKRVKTFKKFHDSVTSQSLYVFPHSYKEMTETLSLRISFFGHSSLPPPPQYIFPSYSTACAMYNATLCKKQLHISDLSGLITEAAGSS